MIIISYLPWLLLILGTGIGLLGYRSIGGFLAAASIGSMWYQGAMTSFAMLYCLLGLMLAAITPVLSLRYRRITVPIVIIWGAIAALHLLPGVFSLAVLSDVTAGPGSLAFSMSLHIDKPMLFFGLLLAYPTLLGEAGKVEWKKIMLSIGLLILLILLACQTGFVHPEFKIPAWLWLFAINNLLLVCTVEEAFFRGFLQPLLSERWGSWQALIITSVLFGAVHVLGGVIVALFACLAGLAYGLAFEATKRLWVSVFVHFAFNMVHLILLTYPAARVVS